MGSAVKAFLAVKQDLPESGSKTPLIIFVSVDLPAPFSPRTASTSPFWSAKLNWSTATTPGKVFVRSSTLSISLIRLPLRYLFEDYLMIFRRF